MRSMRGTRPDDGQRALRAEQLVERGAAHVLHGNPEHAVLLGAERVDVSGEGVVELRGEAGLAQEAAHRVRLVPQMGIHHLDDGFAGKHRLLGERDGAEAALADARAHDKLTERPVLELAHAGGGLRRRTRVVDGSTFRDVVGFPRRNIGIQTSGSRARQRLNLAAADS